MNFLPFALLLSCVAINAELSLANASQQPHQTQTKNIQKIRHIEGVNEYRLTNGLRVLLARDTSKPKATFNITYLVGSRHENYGETGMAHYLEHLLFKGTANLSGAEFNRETTRRGMQGNATTWLDRTNYYQTFPASEDNLRWIIKVEADRMLNALLTQNDLEAEMAVVRNEMEISENNPDQVLMEKMSAAAYQWHNYGKNTIGARSDVELVPLENLRAFYRHFYQVDNAVITLTGQFDEAQALAFIQEHFGAIARPQRSLRPTWTREPAQDGEREVILRRNGDNQFLGIQYHIAPALHEDFAALEVFSHILGDTPSGRLHKTLVKSQAAVSVSHSNMALKEAGYSLIMLQLDKRQKLDKARQLAVQVIENFSKSPPTETELKRAKLSYANYFEDLQNDPEAFGIALSESIAAGDWRLLFLNRDRIEKVTAADVQRVASFYFKESNRTVGQFIPSKNTQRAVIPEAPESESLLATYQGRAASQQGEEFSLDVADIEERTKKFTLSNGMKIAMINKTNRGNTVSGTLNIHFGNEENLQHLRSHSEVIGSLLNRGAGKLSRLAIEDKLKELRSSLNFSSTTGQLNAHFTSRREHLTELMNLLALILKEARFDASELADYKAEALASIAESRLDPASVVSMQLARHEQKWSKSDPRYVASFDEQVAETKALNRKTFIKLQREFLGAQNAQLALVGDFDAAQVQAQLTRLFGAWSARQSYRKILAPFQNDTPKTFTDQIDDKSNAAHSAYLALNINERDSDYPALMMGVHVLGGGQPSRLWQRIREKDGISYGVGTSLSIDIEESRNSHINLNASFAPENRARIEQAYQEEIVRLQNDGVSQVELDEARQEIINSFPLAFSHDLSLSASIARQMESNRSMLYIKELTQKLQALSVAQVNTALKKHLNYAQFVHAYAGDFSKK
jgi:zinc protease